MRNRTFTVLSVSCIFIFYISFVLPGCTQNNEDGITHLKKRALAVEKVSEIKEGGTDNSIAPLSFPGSMAMDSRGYMYIFDTRLSKILVYNRAGEQVNTIGRKGSGPGEIGSLSTLFVDRENRLITADRKNARITVYNADGEVLISKPSLDISRINNIREMPDGRYLLTGWDGQNLLHIVDRQFSTKESSFGKISDFEKNRKENEIQWLQMVSGAAQPVSDKRIAFAPRYYQGVLYVYSRTEAQGWQLEKTHKGYRTIESSVTFTSKKPDSYHGVSFGPEGTMYVDNKTLSFGLYLQDDNALVHLSNLSTGDTKALVIEKFNSPSLELGHYHITDSLDIGPSHRRQIRGINRQGQIFIADYADIPKVEILNIRE